MFLKLLCGILGGYNIEQYLCDLMASLFSCTVAFKIMQNIEIKILKRTKEQGKKIRFLKMRRFYVFVEMLHGATSSSAF